MGDSTAEGWWYCKGHYQVSARVYSHDYFCKQCFIGGSMRILGVNGCINSFYGSVHDHQISSHS